MKIRHVLFLIGLSWAIGAPLAIAGVDGKLTEAVTEWQEAAFNYEYAAEAQENLAESLYDQARQYRLGYDDSDGNPKRAKLQAGNLEIRAADLLIAACTNLDSAAKSWKQAASKAGSATVAGKYYFAAATTATERATALLRRAVTMAEQAALGFAAEDELLSQSVAHQKAANIRERLAVRF